MPVVDLTLRERADGFALTECDVCIVGSGPAGSTLARELSGTPLRVVLLESGGFERHAQSDDLDIIDNVGRPRAVQWTVRNRIVGGSSHTWGGRCAPFDNIDYVQRSWIPHSGWPIGPGDLEQYLERSAVHLGLAYGLGFTDHRFWTIAGRDPPGQDPDPAKLLPFFWQFSRDDKESYPYEYMRFGRHLASRIGPNVTLVAGATAMRVHTDDSGRAVQSVEFTDPQGRRHTVSATTVALCAGGIENARVLLSSDSKSAAGLGNGRDLVGRYLMDHLRGPVARFEVAGSQALQKRFGRYNLRNRFFRAGLRLSPDLQESERLLNSAVWLGEALASDDPWDAIRRLLSGRPRAIDAVTIVSNADILLQSIKTHFVERNGVTRKLSELSLECMVEQQPDPDSRVTLSDQHDELGMRRPRINWRSHHDEARTMHRTAEVVVEQFARLGLPTPTIAEWVKDRAPIPDSFVDVAHPTGTTRMSDNPGTGVVDRNSQVYGVSGLYVGGSSVFPTVGHCNPTQMIVALAIRLADTIKVRTDAAKPMIASLAGTLEHDHTTILVTGGTGRIGRRLITDLLERGYRVRATTSKPKEPDGVVDWRQFDFLKDDDYDGLVAGCGAVLHLAAEIGKMDRMQRVNVDATRRLAVAAEHAEIKAFCYTSSVSVYGSGQQRIMSEGADVLTVDRDVRSEYWALDYVRAYGRTKLAGELAIKEAARKTCYMILRPTVVVDVDDLLNIRDWTITKRWLAAHRHAHHVYVRDLTDALIWCMKLAMGGKIPAGTVETFNFSEDEFAGATHADFMRMAYATSRDSRFRVVKVPGIADWMHDFLRFRSLPLRYPLWSMRFPNDRLRAAGYRHRFGMAKAHDCALNALRKEAL